MKNLLNSILFRMVVITNAFIYFILNKFYKKDKFGFVLLCEEYYHKDLGGFGGFGMTAKNVTEYFNNKRGVFRADVLVTKELEINNIQEKTYHNARVILRPNSNRYIHNYIETAKVINKWQAKMAMTIEYYPSYEGFLLCFPMMPCLIWIKDPRDSEEWRKIASVPLEIEANGKNKAEDLLKLAREKKESIQKVIVMSKYFRRKVIFASQALSIVDIAKKTYGIPDLKPYFLPTPISMPEINEPVYSERPSVCFLGRIDPVKRPWIYFELAKRFRNVEFIVAGETHFPNIMNPIIDKYGSIDNLKFVGHVSSEKKASILQNTWALVNTSIHEAVPVTFLEAFSYSRPVISCHNPDNLVEKYGYYTGELLGPGDNNATLDIFSSKLEIMLRSRDERIEKGIQARKYVVETHSFSNFDKQLSNILKAERIN